MTLYLLEWDNGLSCDDREVTLLGIYTSPHARYAAKLSYLQRKSRRYPFTGSGAEGQFIESDVGANTDLY